MAWQESLSVASNGARLDDVLVPRHFVQAFVQESAQISEALRARDKRGVDLISDVLPFGRLW